MKNREDTCGCCEGTEAITPEPTTNRPGLPALAFRAGTHATFLETMKARLSSRKYPALRALKTRAANDPSIAFLDAWAIVADVLTFYQERLANEGYLRTATERRSVLELARLIGYSLQPGVAASAWLALEIEKDYEIPLQPYELKVQSQAGPGETPQTFENIEPIDMRQAWNRLQPRLKQPQTYQTITQGKDLSPSIPRLYVKGISSNLKQNDVILITVLNQPHILFRVAEVKADPTNDRTLVIFQSRATTSVAAAVSVELKAMADTADRYANAEVMKIFHASGQSQMAQRVSDRLKWLSDQLRDPGIGAEDADHAIRETLSAIAEENKAASDEQYHRLEAWLTAMVKDLSGAAQNVMTAAARLKAASFAQAAAPTAVAGDLGIVDPLKNAVIGLTKKASVPPRDAISLFRDVARIFDTRADVGVQMAGTFQVNLQQTLPTALANVRVAPDSPVRVYAFRAVARPFGYNAPLRTKLKDSLANSTGKYTTYYEWLINDPLGQTDPEPQPVVHLDKTAEVPKSTIAPGQQKASVLYLDNEYKIKSDGWVVVEPPDTELDQSVTLNLGAGDAYPVDESIAAYGLSAKSTRLDLKNGKTWYYQRQATFDNVRRSVIYAESDELALADEPITASICGGDDDLIELDGLYSGLQSGRWLIVAGERDDIKDETGASVRGIKSAELIMLAEVTQKTKVILSPGGYGSYGSISVGNTVLPGDQTHTFIKLAKKLAYGYRRDQVTIYGNVVKATHGETRQEVLGSGAAGQAFQSFSIKQPPLTLVAAPTPAGAESTLQVYVNDLKWQQTDGLDGTGANDRLYMTKTDDDAKTTVIFGNGEHGRRLPTGVENVRALYRNGIGQSGNVRAEQIKQLLSKPLGVKGVINPLRASGGADRESRDTARENAPRAITALDRLVSVQDYADFARTFAGIGKAVSAKITDGRRQWVQVTIAGADDIPIDETSDLYRNLLQALHDYGDPYQPVALQVRELMLLLINLNIRIASDYLWETVAVEVRKKLLRTFDFEVRALGQDVLLSEVIAAIQSVRGVAYSDVDVLGGIPEKKSEAGTRRVLTPQEIAEAAGVFLDQMAKSAPPVRRLRVNLAEVESGVIRPAHLAYLTPSVADTLVINQIK